MSDKPLPPPKASKPPPRTKSGEHSAVRAFREKLESIDENTLPILDDILRQAEELRAKHKSDAPAKTDATEKKEDPPHE